MQATRPTEDLVRNRTGAERYLASRMSSEEYATAYARARAQISFTDTVMNALDEQRRARDLTKAELARRAGLKPEAVRRLFSKHPSNPTMGTICALANALEVDVKVVPRGSDSKVPATRRRSGAA